MEKNDKLKFQYEGLKWLYEMELLNSPQLINNLKLNILTVSNSIKEVELLMYQEQKAILIYIEVSWFAKKFKVKNITDTILERLNLLLPSYSFRVITDRKILELSIKKVQDALKITGGTNENSSNNSGSTE